MKDYTKTQLCERYEINKTTKGQTFEASRPTSQASVAARARFSLGVHLNTHNSAQTHELTDDFLDQCIEEYFTWLAQTELRRSQLLLPLTERHKPIDWSSLQNKEATTKL
jgi:MoxR-like ATPase